MLWLLILFSGATGTLSLTGGGGATVTLSGTTAAVPTLTVSAPAAFPGNSVSVTLADGPGNATDWIGLYPASASDGGPIYWRYLNGTTTPPVAGVRAATVTFTLATAGTYNFRLFRADTFERLAISANVVVTAPAVPIMSVSPATLDFGTAPPGAAIERTVRITNVGDGVLTGQASVSGQPFAIVGPSTYSLGPGEWMDIRLAFRPGAWVAAGAPDVFVVAGQSNAVGQGVEMNQATPGPFVAMKMDRAIDGTWLPLADPTDPAGYGSPWPLLANRFVASQGRDIYVIPCAVGGTSIAQWQPGTPLYTRMIERARAVFPARLGPVLWWQGEADALAGTSQAQYLERLAALATSVRADLGVPLMVAKLQTSANVPAAQLQAINAAIEQAWRDVPSVVRGPDLSPLIADEGFHLTSPMNIQAAGARWWESLASAYGWTP